MKGLADEAEICFPVKRQGAALQSKPEVPEKCAPPGLLTTAAKQRKNLLQGGWQHTYFYNFVPLRNSSAISHKLIPGSLITELYELSNRLDLRDSNQDHTTLMIVDSLLSKALHRQPLFLK